MIKRLIVALFMFIIMSNELVNVVRAEVGFDEPFYSTNDILFYDPRCDVGTTQGEVISLIGNDNIEKIMRFFIAPEQGLTVAQAAGIIGNLMAESGDAINPAIIQGGSTAPPDYKPVNGVGFGIAQWTFTTRQAPLVKYMEPYGDITNLDGQIGYMWSELRGTHADALRRLKETTTAGDAAFVFHKYYEGSADSPDQVARNRGGKAELVHKNYADKEPLTQPQPGESGSSNFAANTSGRVTGSRSCTATSGGSDLIGLVQQYAWPEYKGLTTTPTDAYRNAVQTALGEGRYVGGISYKGIDCGGFVTTLIINSGFDKGYNQSGKGGYTVIQEQWLKENWKRISDTDATDRQPGDVAINDSHTYIFVGPDAFPNQVPIASASLDERAPMQGNESVAGSSFRWYRKD